MTRLRFSLRAAYCAVLLAGCRTTASMPSSSTLAGGDWRLIDLYGASAIPEASARPTLRFDAETMRVSANFGCNRGSGPFTTGSDGALQFGAIATTLRACADQRMNLQETSLTGAVRNTDHYRIASDTLELRQGTRILARFIR